MRIAASSLLFWLAIVGASAAQESEVLRIAAVVNDEVVSVRDLRSRLRIVIVTSGLKDSGEVRRRLARQVLRNLINERLQMQEAKRLNIRVRKKDMDASIARLEQQNNMGLGQFDEFVVRMGLDAASLREQIRATIAWSKVVRQHIRPRVRISEEEVDEAVARMNANRGKPRQLVSEIFLGVDSPDGEESVQETAQRLIDQIKQGANFAALARQFSQSATASVGGDMGWIQEGQLPRELEAALKTMKPMEVRGPIRTPGGYHIVALRERQTQAGGDSTKMKLSLARILMPRPKDASADEVKRQRKLAATISESATSCEDLEKLSKDLKIQAPGRLDDLKLNDLSPKIRTLVRDLAVGKASPPQEDSEGISIVMVCKRSGDANLPARKEIKRKMTLQRLDIMMRRYMRDLRRAAFLDVRV